MISELFLKVSLLGAEWVLYLLVLISVLSVALIAERALFYRASAKGSAAFRGRVRQAAAKGDWATVSRLAGDRLKALGGSDFDSAVAAALSGAADGPRTYEALGELSSDAIARTRLPWERGLALLATIGSNAPFVGLFGTVLGIIQAFHNLSQNPSGGGLASTVTAGISEALVATAFGILVAIPAVVAFNLFQRRVRTAAAEAEALRGHLTAYLLGAGSKGGK